MTKDEIINVFLIEELAKEDAATIIGISVSDKSVVLQDILIERGVFTKDGEFKAVEGSAEYEEHLKRIIENYY